MNKSTNLVKRPHPKAPKMKPAAAPARRTPPKQPKKKRARQSANTGMSLVELQAAYILDPQTHANSPSKRFPRGGTAVPTAAMTPTEKVNPDWSNDGDAIPASLDDEVACAMVFRDINRGSIVYYQNHGAGSDPNGATWGYNIKGRVFETGEVSTTMQMRVTNDFQTFPCAYGVPTVPAFAPHGSMWCAGCLDGGEDRFFWIGKGSLAAITVYNTEATSATDVEVELIRWTPEAGLEVADCLVLDTLAPLTNGLFNFVTPFDATGLPNGAYYTFRIRGEHEAPPAPKQKVPSKPKTIVTPEPTDGEPYRRGPSKYSKVGVVEENYFRVDLSLSIGGNKSVFGHRAVAGFTNSPSTYEDSAIIAASLWFENTAAESYRNGSVYIQQVPRAQHWLSMLHDPTVFVAKSRTIESPAAEGFFGALLPSSVESFDLRHTHTCNETELVDSFYDIRGSDDYVLMYIKVSPSELGAAQKGTFFITHGGEYTTNDPTRDLATSKLTGLEGLAVMDILRVSQPFHKNRIHARDVVRGVKKAYNLAKSVAKVASPFLDGALALL
jgi:hypothetical protein